MRTINGTTGEARLLARMTLQRDAGLLVLDVTGKTSAVT